MAYDINQDELISLYAPETMRRFSNDFLLKLGATQEEADIITDGLMTASMWWHPGQGQGLEKFFRFHQQVQIGGIVPNASMQWVQDGPSTALLDAAKGFGYVSAYRAMMRAVEKARVTGIGMVGVRHSNHFGIAGYHALQAAKQGLIGWSFTNARAEMAPWGSAKMVLGTNPWGIAIPRKDTHAIVLDMALTMSGKGMMRWLMREGKPMPDTWALTPSGERTTDPAAAMDGPVLPIGEYKGYGLSLFTDVIAGVMTGSLFGLSVFQDDSNHDVGHIMMAINPTIFLSQADFDTRLEQLVAEVKDAPAIDPEKPVILPGEVEFGRMRQREQDGIPMSRETVEKLRALSLEVGVDCPF
ncbi:MAG: Ldh family oxidoreductase [Chloroflexi bacterium]|nr:Ldh family oxidoreductase [Chloroflexota bacterium]